MNAFGENSNCLKNIKENAVKKSVTDGYKNYSVSDAKVEQELVVNSHFATKAYLITLEDIDEDSPQFLVIGKYFQRFRSSDSSDNAFQRSCMWAHQTS